MMDESPSEATIPIYGEEVDKNSIMCEALPSQVKVESLDNCNRMKTSIKFHFDTQAPLSEREKRLYWDPMRRENRLDISMKRNIKRLQEVFKNRGLPLDKETLHSAASKDAFDMRGLNESLPSTSEKKPDAIGFRWKLFPKLESYPYRMKHNGGRFEGIRCSLSGYSSELGRKMEASDLMKEKDMTNTKSASFRSWLRRFPIQTRAGLKETPASDEQKKTNEDGENSMEEKAFQNVEDHLSVPFTVPPHTPCATTTKISPGEEKSSDVGNNMPPLFQPGWDSEKIWTTDFHSPPLSVPLNSPTKWKSKCHKYGLLKKMFFSLQLEDQRKESKLKILNSHRGELSTEMDGCEGENISEEIPKPSNHFKQSRSAIRGLHNALNSTEMTPSVKDEGTERLKKLMVAIKEHSERMKCLRSYLRLPARKDSDKVVPD